MTFSGVMKGVDCEVWT